MTVCALTLGLLGGLAGTAGAAVQSATGARADASMACYGFPYQIELNASMSGAGSFEWARIYTYDYLGVYRDARSAGNVIGWVRPEAIWDLGIDPLQHGATAIRIDFYDLIDGRWYSHTEWADTTQGSFWCGR